MSLITCSATVFAQTTSQTFITTTTFTVPAGVTTITVEAWGGGGGGSNRTGASGGGGGGAYTRGILTGLIPGSTLTVTVGTGGAAGANGNNSSVLGIVANGGQSVVNSRNGGAGGAASAVGGIVIASYAGGNGGNARASTGGGNNEGGGGGGGSAFNNMAGNAGGNATATGGTAGTGTGNGGRGADGDGTPDAVAGVAPGGGGGGRGEGASTSKAGAAGQVIITWTPGYLAQINSMNFGSTTWCAGETRTVTVNITNIGQATWTDAGPDVNIGLKWNTNGINWADYYVRTDAGNLAPGSTRDYTLTITASNNAGAGYTTPLTNGANNLTCDLINEGNCLFAWNSGACGPGNSVFTSPVITVVNTTPVQTSAITGNANPCQGYSQTYSVTNVAGVIYTWSFPADWTITAGQGTNSVTVTVGATAGSATVTPSNPCGSGTARTLAVTPAVLPAQPSLISGNTSPCTGTSQTYSITNVAGVTFTWTVPAGWTITAGQGTNTITVTVGAAGGNIQVTPSNACGNGTARTLAVTTSTVPSQPSVITGASSPCNGSSQTYSVTNVASVTYTWTVPAGWTITVGQGTNTITVTVGATAGNIQVTPSNGCGNGTARSLAVTITNVPNQPSAITGSVSPCTGSSQTYSISNVAGVTYTWVFPADWTITGGQNTNNVTVTVGSVTGNVTVTPSNACGNGTARTIAVTIANLPVQPSLISGETNPCSYTYQIYSVANVSGLFYNWSTPPDWFIISGQGTNSISVNIGFSSGNLTVTPTNGCGNGVSQNLPVVVQPNIISGTATADQTICYNTIPALLYGTAPTGGDGTYTYQWEFSIDGGTTWNIAVGANALIYQPGALTQTTLYRLHQISGGTCGDVYTNNVTITINPNLVVGTATADQTICYNTVPAQLNGTAPTGGDGTYTYQWEFSIDGGTIWNNVVGANALTYQSGALIQTTVYRLQQTSGSGCGTEVTNNVTITVNPEPIVFDPIDQIVLSGTMTAPVVFSGPNPGTAFNWTNDNPSVGLSVSGTGNIDSFIAIGQAYDTTTATITVTPSYSNGGVTCIGPPKELIIKIYNHLTPKLINLNLTLEGLYIPALGQMNKAYGRDFPGTIADEITVGLASSTFPYAIQFVEDSVLLDQNGLCQLNVPANFNGEYYIVISHRNSIETWSKFPVAFNQDTIAYNFTDLKSRAYNDNLKLKGTKYCIYAADVNQDGFVDTGDMSILDNESNQFATGYNASDANGDGTTDSGDIVIADNNSYTFTTAFRPFSADPSVNTSSITGISHASAISGGEVISQGSSPVTSRGICWNTSPNPTISNNFTSDGTGAGNFVSTMNNLLPNTNYYIRAYATNAETTVYGYQLIFTTNTTLATISTDEVINITETSATCGGNITGNGGVPVTQRGVCWSILPSPTIADSKTVDGSGSGSFFSSITELLPNTLYYLRAYAINNMGTAYGNEVSFTTTAFLPEVTTAAPNGITATTAIAGGTVTTDGGAAVFQRGVCYGTVPLPTTSNDTIISGNGTGSYISTLTGLIPYTTYYVRAFATNIAGTAYGNEISFTTLAELPSLTTEPVSSITGTSAISGGNITSDGGAPITQRGICYSSNPNPTLADQFTNDGGGSGAYISNLTGLSLNHTYYVRAYAINSAGTAYGNEVSFTTALFIPGNGVVDVEGNTYSSVILGNQEWMGENLKVALYNNGDSIQQVFTSPVWSALSTGGWCWMNNNNQHENPYGKLYNYYTITDSRNLCPTGWHVPTDAEWTILSDYLGGTATAGGKMKETGTIHWNTPNNGATNTSSFTGVAGGYRTNEGTFSNFGNHGVWWSSTEMNSNFSWYRSLFYNTISVNRGNNQKKYGFSVRCIKN